MTLLITQHKFIKLTILKFSEHFLFSSAL